MWGKPTQNVPIQNVIKKNTEVKPYLEANSFEYIGTFSNQRWQAGDSKPPAYRWAQLSTTEPTLYFSIHAVVVVFLFPVCGVTLVDRPWWIDPGG